jgi:hypothetical protein
MVDAGYTIQQLAKRRKKQSVKKFAAATILFIAPALAYLMSGITGISVLIHIGCWITSIVYIRKGQRLLLASPKANLGAEAEKSVALILSELEREGWQIEYNISLRHWGDADAFIRSPKGNCFVVDTKGNGGTIFFDGTKLMLRYGRKVHSFSNNKDILKAVKGQAVTLKEIYRVRFVTPILCFTNANLNIKTIDNKIENVYVLTHRSLIRVLRRLDK